MTGGELHEAMTQLLGRARVLLDGTPTPAGGTWDDGAAAWVADYAEIEDALHPKAQDAT